MLTKGLNEAELQSVKEEIGTMGQFDEGMMQADDDFDGVKQYALVEWKHKEDATLDDVWRIMWEVAQWRGHKSTNTVVFIDRQSAQDKIVIIADLASV